MATAQKKQQQQEDAESMQTLRKMADALTTLSNTHAND
jgi:hypothetical protein